MTKDQTQVGVTIRVVTDRYDAPVGTIARIENVGTVGAGLVWCFNVEWLNLDAVKAYEPYDKIVKPLPEMRRESVTLVKKAIAQTRRSYVLVNNRSEGNAPLTVQALVRALRGIEL